MSTIGRFNRAKAGIKVGNSGQSTRTASNVDASGAEESHRAADFPIERA